MVRFGKGYNPLVWFWKWLVTFRLLDACDPPLKPSLHSSGHFPSLEGKFTLCLPIWSPSNLSKICHRQVQKVSFGVHGSPGKGRPFSIMSQNTKACLLHVRSWHACSVLFCISLGKKQQWDCLSPGTRHRQRVYSLCLGKAVTERLCEGLSLRMGRLSSVFSGCWKSITS